MRVALDVSSAAKRHRTGIGHYVARLAETLPLLDPDVEMLLGVRLGRWRTRGASVEPPPGVNGRVRTRWFPSFWPGLRLGGVDVAHGPDARLVGGDGVQVVTIHDLFNLTSDAWASPEFRRRKAERYAEAGERAARILCVSRATAEGVRTLLRVPAERVSVTPLGVDPGFSPWTEEARAPVLARLAVRPPFVLFVGLLQPRKNLEAVATVFGRLAARRNDLRLVIAGEDGYPEGRAAAILKETGALDRVQSLGYVPQADLPALYSGAGALLFPSHDEGFGLPVLEAMACGCPVVTSDRGSLPEVVGPGGFCFAPTDVDGMEDAVARMVEEPDERVAQVERGRLHAASFTWRRTAESTLEAYRAAVASA